MRIATLLALLVLTQAYAAEPYPEHAGAKYPIEHWRLQLIMRPCNEYCREGMERTAPGFEHYTRSSCIRHGIEVLEDVQGPDQFGGYSIIVGVNCVFIYEDDS